MENKNDMISSILQHLHVENTEEIKLSDDSFIVELSQHNAHGFWKRGARLVGLVLVCLTVIAFVVYGLIFFTKNVLFYRGELRTNQFGTFIPRKSYSSEYAMYLFDASEQWMNSGVQVQKGDVLFISASGAFHTNYRKLVEAATNNTLADTLIIKNKTDTTCLRWVYTNFHIKNNSLDTINVKYKEFNFGDVLYQIVPEYQISNSYYSNIERIFKIPTHEDKVRCPVKINDAGVLAFMVNDKKPENNIGQVLVVMEIFRYSGRLNLSNWYQVFYRWLDFPYYYYEYYQHKGNYNDDNPRRFGYKLWAILVFLGMTMVELILLCLIAFCIPFVLFYIGYYAQKIYLQIKNQINKLYQRMKRSK